MRSIFDFPAENAKIKDCLAERGGFEPPRPFGFGLAKFLASLALYSARIMAQAEQRIYSPWIRLCSAPLWFALFAKARSE